MLHFEHNLASEIGFAVIRENAPIKDEDSDFLVFQVSHYALTNILDFWFIH